LTKTIADVKLYVERRNDLTNIETKLEDLKRKATNAYMDYKSDQ